MIVVPLGDGGARVQAWRCTRDGSVGMIVYSLGSVIRALGAGYVIHALVIDRHPDGTRTYHRGAMLLTERDGRSAWQALGDAMALRTEVPVPGPEMAVHGPYGAPVSSHGGVGDRPAAERFPCQRHDRNGVVDHGWFGDE